MVKRSLLIGIVLAVLPTVFVEAYRWLASRVGPPWNIIDVALMLLVMAAAWLLTWWLISRKEKFPAVELFLAGVFCWVSIGAYYHQLFHKPGAVAIGFAVFAAIYRWFPAVIGRPMVGRLGRIHFWVTYICAMALFHPVADFWYGWQGYIDVVYWFFDNGAFWHFWMSAGVVAQMVFLVNLVYSAVARRKSVD